MQWTQLHPDGSRDDLHFIAHAHWDDQEFELPSIGEREWFRLVDTSLPSPQDIAEDGQEFPLVSQDSYPVKARSVAMFLVRKTAKLSFPEIGTRMGKRNHSTVISACRRIERALSRNESLAWTSSVGEREEEASELIQRLEEHSRAMN